MSSLTPNLARKAKQVLQTKTDDESLLQSLSALSVLHGRNEDEDLQPSQLQSKIELGGVECASELLTQAQDLMTELQNLQDFMTGLSRSCESLQLSVQHCKTLTKDYLHSISRLEKDKEINEEKGDLIKDFLNKYQLLPSEVMVLEEAEINDQFFEVLLRAQSIHSNCRELLRTQHQRAGLDLMDTMARFQESALKRLVQWVQLKCQELLDVEAAETDLLMQRALNALSTRPVLYKYCAEEVAEARHHALFERFVESLSRGPRPIEMQSDDPKRYLNDMLAWVHQALASEKELLEVLFKDISKQVETSKEMPTVVGLLDKIFLSIDRPLKARIEQVLMLPPAPVLCFELSRLLDFYHGVISSLTGKRSHLSESLQSCLDMAERTFHEQIHSRGIRLSRHSLVIPRDLTPPIEVHDTIAFLIQILEANDSALKLPDDHRKDGTFPSMISEILEPLIETCRRSSTDLETGMYEATKDEQIKKLIARESFLINCLEVIVSALADRDHTRSIWTDLKSKLQTHVEAIVNGIVNSILDESGLTDIIQRMEEYNRHKSEGNTMLMASDPALRISMISESMLKFFTIVSDSERVPEFGAIADIEVKSAVMMTMSKRLTDAYEFVYNNVQDRSNGYQTNSEIEAQSIEYSPDDVRTVLSIK